MPIVYTRMLYLLCCGNLPKISHQYVNVQLCRKTFLFIVWTCITTCVLAFTYLNNGFFKKNIAKVTRHHERLERITSA